MVKEPISAVKNAIHLSSDYPLLQGIWPVDFQNHSHEIF